MTPLVFRLGPNLRVEISRTSALAAPACEVASALATETSPGTESPPPVRLDAQPDRGGWMVALDGVPAGLLPRHDLAPAMEAVLSYLATTQCGDWAVVHAAAVRWRDRVFILPAEGKSGKSTLALALGLAGADYLGDDLLFLHYDQPRMLGFPKAVTLKEGAFGQFPPGPVHRDPFRGPLRYILPPRPVSDPVSLPESSRLVFPQFRPGATPALVPIDPEIAALSLVQQAFGGLGVDARLLQVLDRLVRLGPLMAVYGSTEDALNLLRPLAGGPGP